MTRRLSRIISVIVLFSLAGCSKSPLPPEININAKTAIIVEARTGEVLFEKDADSAFPPASTAKVMTAIIAVEYLLPGEEITPSKKAVHVQPTVAGLKPGVKYTLEDLLAAILIKSANDAALVLAEEVAGSEKEFARLMNEKAEEIGMENTYFATASGLPTGKKDAQHTTARDLTRMMRYALKYNIILEVMSQKELEIFGSDGKAIYLKTHNKALLRSDNAPWGKTGYTREAKRTFVGIDPSYKPVVAFALLQSNDLWDDITTLNDQGLEIYNQKYRTLLSKLIRWIKSQKRRTEDAI